MRAHALHGIGHSLDFRDDGVVVVRVEPAYIADLSTGIGVERSVVEHDLGVLTGLELLRSDTAAVIAFDDGQHLASGREALVIAFENRWRQRLVRRAGDGLGAAFPGGAGARALLLHCTVEAVEIESDALISRSILHEVKRDTVSVVKLESFLALQYDGFCEFGP